MLALCRLMLHPEDDASFGRACKALAPTHATRLLQVCPRSDEPAQSPTELSSALRPSSDAAPLVTLFPRVTLLPLDFLPARC